MATVQEKRKAFQQILHGPGGHPAPSSYDVMGALLVERAGFDLVHISGSGVHRSLGFPDQGLLTLTEQAARAALIADAVNLPVLADCETGHGNLVNTTRAVKEFERAGVAAIHIEDQQTPKHPGSRAGFISEEEWIGKVKAALDARSDPSFVIVARMDARDEPYEERIARGMKCVEAGADAIWISFREVEDIKRVVKEIPKPMMGIPRRPQITPRMYGELGYKVAVLPGILASSACIGMAGALKALKENDSENAFYESLPYSAEVREFSGAIGSWSEDLVKRYYPAGAGAGGGGGH
jgi:2-methylisocitrate lyase-like PEP mutase family enzyme